VPKLQAVLFDLDGTLRDTTELIYSALDHTFKYYGVPSPSAEDLAPYIHHHTFVRKRFAPDINLEDFERVYGAKADALLTEVQLYDYAKKP